MLKKNPAQRASSHPLGNRTRDRLSAGGLKEALVNSACPLAFRLGRIRLGCNQGVVSKACRDLSRNHNAECSPA